MHSARITSEEHPADKSGDIYINEAAYLDALLASVAWNNEDAPLNIGVPDYTDSFESNEGIYLLEITGGSVRHIENVGRATDVIVDPNEDYVLGSNLQVNGAVMNYRYDVSLLNGVTLERGELTVTINGVEADFDVNVYLVGGPAGYYATLGTVKTTAIGTIADVEVSHNDLDAAVVKMIQNSVQNHYTLDVADAVTLGLAGFIDTAVKEVDISAFIRD
uniref:Uncharacterized protein n=1 Tax=Timema monikensis TaxID=170555 RepID=A0A7R9EIR7_9NEOP|nr:unnamed protein product [Timema monikensis]